MYTQKSFNLKPADSVKKWHLVNAEGKVLGRLASEIASLLKGKRNPQYTPNVDTGDFVVVVNAEKFIFTGNKLEDKNYNWHTNHTGGIKTRSAKQMLERKPTEALRIAIKGMMPKGTLGVAQLKKLRLFAGNEHTHEAQKPVEYKI